VSSEPEVQQLKAELRSIMVAIRKTTPRNKVNSRLAKGTEIWEANYAGLPVRRAIIYLRSAGCHWAIKHRSDRGPDFLPGCFDCEHSVADTTLGRAVSASDFIEQFEIEYERLVPFYDYPILCLYNEGNFFRESELPRLARSHMLKRIGETAGIKRVIIESLPDTLTPSVLRDARDLLGGKELEIGIGLESSDPLVRELCVNKPYDLPVFERAVREVKNVGGRVLAYVLLKPCFLSERQAIRDAIATIHYAKSVGVDVVSLEPVNPSGHNMSGALAALGMHRSPWFWSVIEVLRAAYGLIECRIGGYQFAPRYTNTPFNGASRQHLCNDRFENAVRHYNSTYKMDMIDRIDCICRTDWLGALQASSPGLLLHVQDCASKLAAYYEVSDSS
jgi:archaeosine synthase beta-subunit